MHASLTCADVSTIAGCSTPFRQHSVSVGRASIASIGRYSAVQIAAIHLASEAKKTGWGWHGGTEIAFSPIYRPSVSLLRAVFKLLPWILCCSVADYRAANDSARVAGAFC